MAVSCQTFSLGYILIDYVFDAAVAIANDNQNGGDEGGRVSVRHAAKSGGYCGANTTPPIKTFALKMLQHPLRPATPV